MSDVTKKKFDVVIVGGGSSGLTAALFASRQGLSTCVISQDIGGQAGTTPDIENYPGIDFTDGLDLMNEFKTQAEKYGAELRIDTVHKVEPIADNRFKVVTNTYEVEAEVVILAFGLSHRHLNVPGEQEYIGKGVSYCAICETEFYKKKNVAVIGGGNSAVQAALILAQHAQDVTLVNVNDSFRAEAVVMEKMNNSKNIKAVMNAETKEIVGDKKEVTGLVCVDKESGEQKTLNVSRVFVEIGYVPKADWIKDLVKTDERNQIIISDKCETSQKGIYAAGDITTIAFKQVVISAGEGAKAALAAHKYLLEKTGKRAAHIDWGRKK